MCMYSWEGLLDLENEKYVVSVFYLGRAQLLSPSCYFGVSVHRRQTPAGQPGAHLSPASGCDLRGFNFPPVPKKRNTWLLNSLPRCGTEGEESGV